MIKINIGRNIKQMRESRKITQQQLADALGIDKTTISSWERDRTQPTIGMVEKMSLIFNCRKSELVPQIDKLLQIEGLELSLYDDSLDEELLVEIAKMDSRRMQMLVHYAKVLNGDNTL